MNIFASNASDEKIKRKRDLNASPSAMLVIMIAALALMLLWVDPEIVRKFLTLLTME